MQTTQASAGNGLENYTFAPHISQPVTSNVCRLPDIIYSIIGCIGVLDNGFVLFVIYAYKPMRRRLTNLFIINQTFVDFLASVVLLAGVHDCGDQRGFQGMSGELYCRLWRNKVFLWSLLLVSTYNLVGITVDRYLEIVHPVWHKNHITRRSIYTILVLSWVVGMGWTLPFGVGASGVIQGKCVVWDIFPSPTVGTVVAIFNFVLSFPLPVAIMIYSYTRMIITFRIKGSSIQPGGVQSGVTESDKERNSKLAKVRMNIFTTMLIVSVCFVLCWVWSKMWYLLKTAGMSLSRTSVFYHFSVYAITFNSVVNPFVYIARYEQFQKAVKIVVLRKKGGSQSESSATNTSLP